MKQPNPRTAPARNLEADAARAAGAAAPDPSTELAEACDAADEVLRAGGSMLEATAAAADACTTNRRVARLAFLDFRLRKREQAQASLAEAVGKDPLYALGWAEQGAVELALGDLYREVDLRITAALKEHGGERHDHVEPSIAAVAARAREQLLGNELRATGGSPFANAVDAARREAASRFVRDNRSTTEG